MKILITGADGFIGSHLCETLYAKGHKIRALSQYNSFNFWGHLENLDIKNELEIISGDLRDGFFCEKLCEDIEAVFHLAALIAIPYSYRSAKSYVDTNVLGTLNMLEAAKKHKLKAFIHISSSEVYGSALYTPIDEKHPLQPQSPYSATKIAADMLALSYYYSFDLPVIIARPFNTYGPRQSARAIIPTIITQILSGAKELRLGDLSPKRDFNFVKDTCEALATFLELDNFGEVFNIGSGLSYSMAELVELIIKLLDAKLNIISDEERYRPLKSEVRLLLCESAKLYAHSGFKNKFSLEEGLKITIEWFKQKQNLQFYKSQLYNV